MKLLIRILIAIAAGIAGGFVFPRVAFTHLCYL